MKRRSVFEEKLAKSHLRLRGYLHGLLCFSLVISACGAVPEGGAGGQCSLSCAKAIIGSSDFSLVPMSQDELTFQCPGEISSTGRLDGPILLKFKVSKSYALSDGSARQIPVPAISFDPLITGLMDNAATHASLQEGTNGEGAYRYAGVVTPKSEWCSDSCGVMSIEIQPLCVANATNEVVTQVHSGSLSSDPVKIAVRNGVAD